MLCKRGLSRHAVPVCPCLCLSITFVHSVKTNKDMFKMLSTSGSQGIVVFLHQTAWRYSARNSLNEGVKYDTIVCIQRAVKD